MSSRAYTVAELDALRNAVENKWLFGFYQFTPERAMRGGMSRSYSSNEKDKAVEERVRTHMLAGHTAEDLFASEAQSERTGA